jgi:hypothetical protein
MRAKSDSLWDKIWRDRRGHVVVWQTPNASLIGWAVLTMISLFLNGTAANIFVWLGMASIVIWSLLEMTKGVNYFRRILGAVVMLLVILSVVHIA